MKGYQSGLSIIVNKEQQFSGISFDYSRPQTKPDVNGRVSEFHSILKNDSSNNNNELKRQESLKKMVSEAIKQFRLRRVYIPNDGSQPQYLDD